MILAEDVQKEIEVLDRQLLEEKRVELERQTKSTITNRKSKEIKRKSSEIQQQQIQNQQEENRFAQPNEELLMKQEMLQELFENIMTDDNERNDGGIAENDG